MDFMKETTLNFLNSACSNMYSCGVLAIAFSKPLESIVEAIA